MELKLQKTYTTSEIEKTRKLYGMETPVTTYTIGDIERILKNTGLTDDQIRETPMIVQMNYGDLYTMSGLHLFSDGHIEFSLNDRSNKLIEVEEDKRPSEGEYCEVDYKSSHGNLHCLCKSTNALTRLLLTMKYVLEKEDIRSSVVYQTHEVIFSPDEFDIDALEDMIMMNDEVVTVDMFKKAKVSTDD